jgi:hypothetical protein
VLQKYEGVRWAAAAVKMPRAPAEMDGDPVKGAGPPQVDFNPREKEDFCILDAVVGLAIVRHDAKRDLRWRQLQCSLCTKLSSAAAYAPVGEAKASAPINKGANHASGLAHPVTPSIALPRAGMEARESSVNV